MNQVLTDSGTLVRLAYQALKKLSVDADEVLRRANLEPDKLYQANLRTAFSAQPAFWKAAVELSGDPAIGLHMAETMPTYKGQVIEYLLLTSDTFGEGLKRVMSYQKLLSDALHIRLSTNGSACLHNEFQQPEYATSHLSEAMVFGLIRVFQSVTDGAFQPLKISFHHQPNADISEYRRIYGCDVEFGGEDFTLHFDPSLLGYRSLYAEPELLSMHVRVADQHMELLRQQELIKEVRRQIGAQLEFGEPTLESISEKLAIAPRQLRYQLDSAGTSFQKILNNLRRDLACRLLANTDEAISEIVYLTGFSEPSTFYRAFKRWKGVTPLQYREGQLAN